MKPREINPECIDDDAWWDLEALKLAVVHPEMFRNYALYPGLIAGYEEPGSKGLLMLGFLSDDSSFNRARAVNFGSLLVEACRRVSKQFSNQKDDNDARTI